MIFMLAFINLFQYILPTNLIIQKEEDMPTPKKPLTKSQIVTHFAEMFKLPKKTASSIIDEMATLATNETKKTGAFTFPGIGKLVLVRRKARVGRNPATGEAINIPAKTVVKMRIAKACKDAIVPPKK